MDPSTGRRCVVVAGAVALGLAGALAEPPEAQEGHAAPWPSPVPGFKAPAPGEHPRLFFRRRDLSALKRRAQTAEGRGIIKRLRFLLNGGDGESMPTAYNPGPTTASARGRSPATPTAAWYTISHTAGFGFLYRLTGDRKYADLGRRCMEEAFEECRDRDRRYAFRHPSGALRAGPSLGWTAVGYDLCYDGWDEDFRRRVAEAIQNYDEGENMSLGELVRGSRHMPTSNHWGMQVGGGALAVLAIMNDPGVDTAKLKTAAEGKPTGHDPQPDGGLRRSRLVPGRRRHRSDVVPHRLPARAAGLAGGGRPGLLRAPAQRPLDGPEVRPADDPAGRRTRFSEARPLRAQRVVAPGHQRPRDVLRGVRRRQRPGKDRPALAVQPRLPRAGRKGPGALRDRQRIPPPRDTGAGQLALRHVRVGARPHGLGLPGCRRREVGLLCIPQPLEGRERHPRLRPDADARTATTWTNPTRARGRMVPSGSGASAKRPSGAG